MIPLDSSPRVSNPGANSVATNEANHAVAPSAMPEVAPITP